MVETRKIKFPEINEQMQKTPCLIQRTQPSPITDKQEKEAVTINEPLLDDYGKPLMLNKIKDIYDSIVKKPAAKISGDELERATLIAETFLPGKTEFSIDELEAELKHAVEFGVGCECGRFYMFKPKLDLSGWRCVNGVYNEASKQLYCDSCGAIIEFDSE